MMEAFRDQFTTTELPSYKEVLYDEATEEWYVQRDPDEVERGERNCMCFARQFCYRERSVAIHIESYLLYVYYTSELDNLHDDTEIDQLELDWIIWQRDFALNKTWGDSIVYLKQCI